MTVLTWNTYDVPYLFSYARSVRWSFGNVTVHFTVQITVRTVCTTAALSTYPVIAPTYSIGFYAINGGRTVGSQHQVLSNLFL